ncbi:uncharacterized protein LOC123201043 [Mangifera indica]|uniref:uncharacterized protein LOC123201043 n=1 Tax=Mangifera indica TaxID=29780 RepID=UPI001CF9FD74|nr:uncharacterized protein LOC123201043 [Mangifera indica]
MIPKSVQVLGTLNFASTVTLGALRAVTEAKRKKVAAPCGSCKGKGFYKCKLCKGNATVKWSPFYDPCFSLHVMVTVHESSTCLGFANTHRLSLSLLVLDDPRPCLLHTGSQEKPLSSANSCGRS